MSRPAIIDLPYPDISVIEKDLKAATIIAPAYAGMHGELNAILQYLYHYFIFKREGDEQTAQTLMEISVAEMHHFKMLGELFTNLGVDPVYSKMPPFGYNYYTAASVSYSKTPVKMLVDDVSGEILAIKTYERMCKQLKNERVAAIIKRICMDEELHVKALKECLERYGGENLIAFEVD